MKPKHVGDLGDSSCGYAFGSCKKSMSGDRTVIRSLSHMCDKLWLHEAKACPVTSRVLITIIHV